MVWANLGSISPSVEWQQFPIVVSTGKTYRARFEFLPNHLLYAKGFVRVRESYYSPSEQNTYKSSSVSITPSEEDYRIFQIDFDYESLITDKVTKLEVVKIVTAKPWQYVTRDGGYLIYVDEWQD